MSEGDEIKKPLGKGGQGCVKLVEHNGQRMARKEINVKKNGLEQCLKEVKMIEQLRDRHVLIFKEYYHDKEHDKFYIYTEYFRNRDLRRLIEKQNHKDFEIPIVIKYMKDLINVVKYIHSKNIIHRDLKPGNILVSDNNELVIGDLGLAVEKGMSHYGFGGTPNYIAPEIYENEENPPYSEASDIFALGCIFYEIYTLKQLFNENESKEVIKDKITSDLDLVFERNFERNSSIEKLIIRMVEKDPNIRINLDKIEERMEIIEDDLEASSRHDSTVYTSVSRTISVSQHHNLTVGFYLFNECIENMSLAYLCELNQNDFNREWNYEYAYILFPTIGQNNPPFTLEDALLLKNRKSEYLDNLRILLNLLRSSPNYMSSGISYSIDLFLDIIELPEFKQNPLDEQRIQTEFINMFNRMFTLIANVSSQ